MYFNEMYLMLLEIIANIFFDVAIIFNKHKQIVINFYKI